MKQPSTLQDKPFWHRAKNLLGLTFGSVLVTHYEGSNGRKTLWKVVCTACGSIKTLNSTDLQRAKSCGCLQKQSISTAQKTHGMTKTPIYAIYRSMIDRCKLPTHQAWKNYGGRGIEVDDTWKNFIAFYNDMYPTYQPGLTLDRINNNGNYSKENCRWVTYEQNANNRRTSKFIDTPQGKMTIAQAARYYGIGTTTLHYRIKAGIAKSQLFTKPNVRNRFMT
jgi:hypothetical protein